MNRKAYELFFKNFANKTKLDIILCLKENRLSVGEISEKTGIEQSNVSHQLKDLLACKIVNMTQKGKQRIYSLNRQTAVPMLELVEKHAKKNCPSGCNKKCFGCKNAGK